jgi:hypothetical protein
MLKDLASLATDFLEVPRILFPIISRFSVESPVETVVSVLVLK